MTLTVTDLAPVKRFYRDIIDMSRQCDGWSTSQTERIYRSQKGSRLPIPVPIFIKRIGIMGTNIETDNAFIGANGSVFSPH